MAAAAPAAPVAAAGAPPAVRIQDVSKTFPGQKALDGVSFTIAPGRIHALLGHNGSGKSTLIKILAGVYTADPGARVEVDGEPLALGSPREAGRHGLRFVHQDLGLIGPLTAAENMALTWGYPRTVTGRVDGRAHAGNVRAALSRLQVEVDIDRPVAQLRAVERTAVAIARALREPGRAIGVLVLDEPTAALPPAEVESLFAILRDVRDQGVAILYVSHRLGEVLALADDASVLRDGRLQHSVPLAGLERSGLVQMILGDLDGVAPEVGGSPGAPAGGAGGRSRRRRAPEGEPVFTFDVSSRVLEGVRLALHRGEIVGVAGLAGSGRDELCEALVGAVPASCVVHDRDHGRTHAGTTPAAARRLGIALVLPNRVPRSAVAPFSVAENVSLPSLGAVVRQGVVRRRAERSLAETWIDRLQIQPRDAAKAYAHLSGGNQQKTIFAKWLAIRPRLLLLEDPTTGVDVGARSRIYELIEEQAADGLAVLVASSDIEDLVALCDRVLVITQGRVTDEVVGDDITEARLLTSLNDVALAAPLGGEDESGG